MKRIIPVIISTALLLVAGGCRHEQTDSSRQEAHDLYMAQVNLLGKYIDSLRHAPDSAAAYSIDQRFQQALTRINMDASAELDTKLTEGENDTLFLLTERYVRLRDKKVGRSLLAPLPSTDSTAAEPSMDSVVLD